MFIIIHKIRKQEYSFNAQQNPELILTIAEDLNCSGLPVSDEEICTYDEGFIKGLLFGHTGKIFTVKEIDCWCSGDRVCRFRATQDAQ